MINLKYVIKSEVGGFKKKEFLLAWWKNSSNDLLENLIFFFGFSCYCTEVVIENVGNFPFICDCFIAL